MFLSAGRSVMLRGAPPRALLNAARQLSSSLSLSLSSESPTVRWSNRSHTCGELTAEDVGRTVSLSGWVKYSRMGGRFVVLGDVYGDTQLVCQDPQAIFGKDALRPESVVRVSGTVRTRPDGQENNKMRTGGVEVEVDGAELLSSVPAAGVPVLASRQHNAAREETAMRHRHLALRGADLQRRLRARSEFCFRARQFFHQHGFVEVETPTLFRRTPGGAQEFVVPTRSPGRFYSLSQSPQQLKQLLMSGGVDRYFQFARCYRDEGARPDRQPEFTQIDVELSFTDREKVKGLVESLLRHAWPADELGPVGSFDRMTHAEALRRFGSDKPDLRFREEIVDVTDVFRKHDDDDFVNNFLDKDRTVRAIALVKTEGKESPSSAWMKKLEVEVCQGLKERPAVSTFVVNDRGELKSSLFKKCPADLVSDMVTGLNLAEGSVGALACGRSEADVLTALGRTRKELSEAVLDLSDAEHSFLWVENFPLFEVDSEGGICSSHHPFTRPVEEDAARLFSDPLSVRGQHYDLVLNGEEVAGGSVRVHEADLQRRILRDLLRLDPAEFEHLLEALSHGCPPHAGVAFGLDRLVAAMLGCATVRDVMAFPKTASGRDVMADAPAEISPEDMELYHIRVVKDEGNSNKEAESVMKSRQRETGSA